jgi:hypothetical protein
VRKCSPPGEVATRLIRRICGIVSRRRWGNQGRKNHRVVYLPMRELHDITAHHDRGGADERIRPESNQ